MSAPAAEACWHPKRAEMLVLSQALLLIHPMARSAQAIPSCCQSLIPAFPGDRRTRPLFV